MRRRITTHKYVIGLSVLGLAVLGACSKKSSSDDDTPAATKKSTSSSAKSSSSSSEFALAGTVASTASSSTSLLLGLADIGATVTYQVAGDPTTAEVAAVDPITGDFSFTEAQAATFVGKTVEGYVTSPDGDVVVLPPLPLASSAVVADVSITYDSESGAGDQKVVVTDSSGASASSDDTYAPLSSALMAFDPTPITSEYSRINCEIDRTSIDNKAAIKAVKAGDLAGTKIDPATCSGWQQGGLYLRGEKGVVGSATPLVQDTPPTLQMWNRKSDYDACYGTGSLKMAISDGTNTFDFGSGNKVDTMALYDKIKAYGWAPQVALDRATAANPEDAPSNPKDTQLRTMLLSKYTDPCSGLSADLAKDWAKVADSDVKKIGGRSFCGSTLVYDTPVTELNTMMNKEISDRPNQPDSGLRDVCGMYKRAKTDPDKKKAVNKFVAMCNEFIAGKPGQHEQDQAKIEVVDSFVRSIADLKWQTGDTRFDALKNAMKGLDLDNASDISSANLKTMATEWMSVSWDWRSKKILEYAIASMDSAMTIASNDNWLNIAAGTTGKQAIVGLLSDSHTRSSLDELVCSDQWQMPTLAKMVDTSYLTVLENELTTPSQDNNFQSTWKSDVLLSDKKSLLLAFIDSYLTQSPNHCEQVRLASQRTQINSYTEGGNNNPGGSPVDNFPQFMLGGQLQEAKQRKVMQDLGSLLANGTYTQLREQMVRLESFKMGGEGYMSKQLDELAQQGMNEAGLLYNLKQMLGGEAARSAFRYNDAYLAKMQTIKQASSCLPDAQVNWQSDVSDDGSETHSIVVNGPVKQIFKAPLALNGTNVKAVSTTLQSGGTCYWGNSNGFSAIPATAFANTDGFVSPYMMAWFNGCGSASSSDSSADSLNGMFTVTKITPVVNQ